MNKTPRSTHIAPQYSPEHGRRGVRRIGLLLRAPPGNAPPAPNGGARLPFGKVIFGARDRLGLANDTFLLGDVIRSLAQKTGWCYASSEYLATTLGVSTRHLRRHLRTLFAAGLLEQRRERGKRQLRTTSAWEMAVLSGQGGQHGHEKRTECPTDIAKRKRVGEVVA